MAKKGEPRGDETAQLLKYLLAIELYRSGLSKADIRARLGLGMNVVNEMLKGVSKEVVVRKSE
jgi:hypothetical protein